MRIEQQPAYILHSRAYRETSLLLECFTRDHGRIGVVARGVRRERSRTPRALLQPLVPIELSWSGSGELATLIGVESAAASPPLVGEALLCGLYLNELLLRMTQRHDPHAELFAAYARAVERLADAQPSAWTLRRFERDLLDRLGYGVNVAIDASSGVALDPAADYGYRRELGTVPWRSAADGPRIKGAALLALARDQMPPESDWGSLRRWMRHVIAGHLEGGELKSWKLLGAIPLRRGD